MNVIRLCSSGKFAHPTKETADQELKRATFRTPGVGPKYSYHCPKCGYWHLTAGRRGRRRRG